MWLRPQPFAPESRLPDNSHHVLSLIIQVFLVSTVLSTASHKFIRTDNSLRTQRISTVYATVEKLAMRSPHLTQLRKWMLESPPVEWGINHFRELLIGAMRQGPIPQHVAFVMDGNRRFARSHKIETVEGHNLGFEALARV
jgi:hypothetical protein